MEKQQERALLIGLNITTNVKKLDDIDINESMEELKELTKAAGAEVVGSLIQNKECQITIFLLILVLFFFLNSVHFYFNANSVRYALSSLLWNTTHVNVTFSLFYCNSTPEYLNWVQKYS